MSDQERKQIIDLAKQVGLVSWVSEDYRHFAFSDDECASEKLVELVKAALAQQAVPMTHQQQTKAALWDLAVEKGLVTVHSEQLAPGTWSAHLSVASWIEGHEKACDISNEAAVLAAAPAAPQAGNWIDADDVQRLIRELDVLLNGEEGAAPQASLCDLVAQVRAAKQAAPQASQGGSYAQDGDRQMLLSIMQELENSVWNCEHCGHAEDTKTMDVAYMLRSYLAAPQAEQQDIPADFVREFQIERAWKLGYTYARDAEILHHEDEAWGLRAADVIDSIEALAAQQAERKPADVITSCQRIMVLIDTYAERQSASNRLAIREVLLDLSERAHGIGKEGA